MNIYEALGVFVVVLTSGLGVSVIVKFVLDGVRANFPKK